MSAKRDVVMTKEQSPYASLKKNLADLKDLHDRLRNLLLELEKLADE